MRLGRKKLICSLLAALGISTVATDLRAQHELEPPRLTSSEERDFAEKEAHVVLEITVGANGEVSDAEVIESAGDELDGRAITAVKRLHFEPATADGEPIAVRIRFEYRFSERPRSEPSAPKSTPERPAEPPPAPKPVESDEYVATAEVERPREEPTRRTLSGPALTTMPGTRGDALRAIEILPGVGRTSVQDGRPILRGSAAFESETFIEGVPVPLLFHLGGVTSVVSSRLLERVDLYPGNFSSRYGRVVGGIVDATVRSPRSDRLHAMVDLSVVDSSALVEAPLGENTRFAVAARRSNIDFFFEKFVPSDAYGVIAAPVYWDYQALAEQRIDKRHSLSLFVFGSRDSLQFFFAKPNTGDVNLRGDLAVAFEFHRAQIRLDDRFSEKLRHTLRLTVGHFDVNQVIGPLYQKVGSNELYARSDWQAELDPSVMLRGGLDLALQNYDGSYGGPLPTSAEGDPAANEPSSLRRQTRFSTAFGVENPAAYLELGLRPTRRTLIVPGVRADYFSQTRSATIDPRLNVRLGLGETTTLKGGIGRYSQTGEFWQAMPELGNPRLKPYHALHASAGIEQRIDWLELSFEGFYKWLDQRVVATPNGVPPHFVNAGTGRIYGIEIGAEAHPSANTSLFGAYTLSRSERRDGDVAWRLFDQDQTHNLALAATQKLGKGWSAGVRFRLVSGNPTTPVLGSVYDTTSDVYVPVYGAINSRRAPMFHQLDLRVEKMFDVGPGTLAVYLELLNAYNHQNIEGVGYSYDYTRSQNVTGLPLLPNFGVRGEI